MGVDLSKLVPRTQITFNNLRNKKIAVDTYIELHQFLKSMPELRDGKGRVTTHLYGVFFRTINLLENKIKPVFVLDGPFPEIKKHQKITDKLPDPRTTNTISPEMIKDLKHMLHLLGLPIVQAPSESEAQCAHMCNKKEVYAVASQDFDSLLFGADRMIINFTMAKKRALPKKSGQKPDFVYIGTYLVELRKVLRELNLNHDQLIALCMLLGTDFNPGVYGLGHKKALHLVQKWKDFSKLFKYAGWNYSYTWKEIYDCIKTIPVTNKYKLKWDKPDKEGLEKFLVKERNFDAKKIKKALDKV